MTLLASNGFVLIVLSAVGFPLPHARTPPLVGIEHPWHLVDSHSWQIESPAAAEPATETDTREGTRGGCSEGMVTVSGDMYEADFVEALQDETCTAWIDRKYPERCASFDRSAWLKLSARKRKSTHPMRFCIDRFEYPNQKNAYPIVDVTWGESSMLCKDEGKRLCSESEWTFACEGDEAMPYPTGYIRDAVACVIDRPWRFVDESELAPRDGIAALVEIDRLWQGEISGSHPRCRSVFGVYDLIGNVDEWTSSANPGERPSILKGGYWGPDRARCRPSTRSHGTDFSYYQQGFRCCADLER